MAAVETSEDPNSVVSAASKPRTTEQCHSTRRSPTIAEHRCKLPRSTGSCWDLLVRIRRGRSSWELQGQAPGAL
eukprot:12555680-Alexandrium_andersonii.AAC.1